MYSGNLGHSHDVTLLVEAANALRADPRFHFMIIGRGPAKDAIRARVEQYELANVTLLPYQPDEVLPMSLATADVAAVSIRAASRG